MQVNFLRKLAVAATVLSSLAVAQQSASAAEILYGMTGAGGTASSLYTIDPTTGASTLVGATGFGHVVAMDFNPVDGLLYGISNSSGGTLLTIDVATGAGTAIATLGGSMTGSNAPDMAFNAAGTLYTWNEPFTDNLNTVDLGTGVGTEIGPNGGGAFTFQLGLDIDSSGTVYIKNGDNDIYTVDTGTGAATFLITHDAPAFALDNILAFNAADTLFSVDRTSGSDSDLYTIDLATGGSTLIGSTGIGRLAALAFQPMAAISVPEPGTLGILGLGVFGLGFARRRKAA